MKTAELTGRNLDFCVAKALNDGNGNNRAVFLDWHDKGGLHYSSTWGLAGPIIDREEGAFQVERMEDGSPIYFARMGTTFEKRREASGPTHLIAAMRAYVASKLGDEVPDEAQSGIKST